MTGTALSTGDSRISIVRYQIEKVSLCKKYHANEEINNIKQYRVPGMECTFINMVVKRQLLEEVTFEQVLHSVTRPPCEDLSVV